MQLIIDTTLPEIAAHLHTLRTRLGGDLTEPMSAVAALLENSSRKRFETQTDPDGQPWAPLAEATQKIKGKKGSLGRGILTDEGLMRRITSHATADMAMAGTGQPYAVYHQLGTKKMPARPIFGLSAEDKDDIRDALTDWLDTIWSDT
jgi:phage virion morphogenesis protein